MVKMSGGEVASTVRKRSIVIAHHKTSVSLEDDFWTGLKEIAIAKNKSVGDLVAEVALKPHANLSSHLRLFVLSYYQQRAAKKNSLDPLTRYEEISI